MRLMLQTDANKKKPHRWKKGETGNPAGRPKEGQSWAGTIKRITDMSRDELIEYVGGPKSYYGNMLKRLPANLPAKEMVVLSAVIQQIIEPNAKLFSAVTDREDGKPAQPIVGKEDGPIEIVVTHAENKSSTT